MAKQPAIRHGFTGKTGGALGDRKRMVTAKGIDGNVYVIGQTSDEQSQVRGNGGAVMPQQTRNAKVLKHPRHKAQSRAVTVTRNGRTFTLTSNLRDPNEDKRKREYEKRIREMERESAKRQQFVRGAEYGETWQSHNDSTPETARTVAYYFRGTYYNSLDEYLTAIDAIG